MSSKSIDAYKAAEEKRNQEREAAEQNSLFREIDDELRGDQFQEFWKRFGKYIIGGALAIVVSVAGYQIHKGMKDSERTEQAVLLDGAYTEQAAQQTGKATALLQQLEKSGNTGYRILARMKHAALLLDQGKVEEGRAILQVVASDSEAPAVYRDLAVVLNALAGLDTDEPQAIEDQLAPMTAAGHPWRHVALEFSALAMARGGEAQRAADTLKEILDDPDTPADQRKMIGNLRTVFLQDAEKQAK